MEYDNLLFACLYAARYCDSRESKGKKIGRGINNIIICMVFQFNNFFYFLKFISQILLSLMYIIRVTGHGQNV
jgi:hypothetical protein